jgi:predicted nucleic acid-binding protein
VLVVTEVAYLAASRLGPEAEAHFIADFARGILVAEQVALDDWTRIVELVAHYRDLPLGTVDASLIAAAERLHMDRVATLDRRHFSVVRPAHAAAFQLLP